MTVVIGGAPEWSAAGPGRVRRAPWVVWGHVGVVECAFSASLVQDLRLRKWSIHSVCQSRATRRRDEGQQVEGVGVRRHDVVSANVDLVYDAAARVQAEPGTRAI